MKIKQWLTFSLQKIEKYSISKSNIEIILIYVLKKKKKWILLNQDITISFKFLNKLNYLLSKILNFEPIDYLVNNNCINFLKLYITKNSLIPRISTSILIKLVIQKIQSTNTKILDLGTGCGLISVIIAKIYKNLKIIGADSDIKSLLIAKKNSTTLCLKNLSFIFSNWFSSVSNLCFDIIVSNPPYISYQEVSLLNKNVFFEPLKSLFSKKNGLKDIKYIIQKSKKYLNIQGWLLIEHGWKQKKTVVYLFKINGYININSYKDQYGFYRITIGQK